MSKRINLTLLVLCFALVSKSQITKLTDIVGSGTNGRIASDQFGYSVAISGDVIVIGALNQDYDASGANSVTDVGAVYVFSKDQGGSNNWGLVKKLVGSGTNGRIASDQFGFSVSISGDVIVVGARYQDYDASGANFLTDAGAVYIFSKDQGGSNNWGLVKKLVGSGTNGRNANDYFGHSVAISGDIMVVGAYRQGYDASGANSVTDAGAVYVYSKDQGGSANWGLVKKLAGSGTNGRIASDQFGFSVSISDDLLVVGARFQDYDTSGANSVSAAGASYIFSKDQGGSNNWGLVKKLAGSGTNSRNANDYFGHSVSISGDVIVVGAYRQGYDASGANFLFNVGASFVFSKDQGGSNNWGLVKKLVGSGTNGRNASDQFGWSVVISGDVIVVGATGQDYDASGANSVSAAGASYIFSKDQGGSDNWGLVNKLAGSGTNSRNANDNFGHLVAKSGDVIAIGVFDQDYDASGANFVNNAGRVSIYSLASEITCTAGSWNILPDLTTDTFDINIVSGTCTLTTPADGKSITISTGATLSLSSGADDLTLTDSYTNNGATTGSGDVILGGTAAQSILGTGITNNLILNNSTGASITDSLKISGVYTHTAGTLTTNNKLRLVATDSITYGQIAGTGSGSISGQVIAEYFIPSTSNGKWRSIGSPLTGVTIGDLSDDININYGSPSYLYSNVWAYDESNGGSSARGAWAPISSSTQTMDNTGFSVYLWDDNVSTDLTIDVQGTYSDGDYTTSALTKTGSIADTSGYHILRNPWPSNYNHTGTITNLQSNTIYVAEGSTIRDWNGTTGSLSNGVVPPFHAIYVEINTHNNTLTFPDANRTTSNSANYFDKNGLINYIAIKATGENNNWDETRVYQDDKAENGFDNFDAKKRVNGEGAPTIYTLVGDKKVSINLIKNIPTKGISFPLIFSAYESGKYTLSFTVDNVEPNVEVVLEDLDTKAMHTITDGEYDFTYDTATAKNQRFVLHYQRKSGTTSVDKEISKQNIFVSSQNKEVHINFGNEGDYTISIYDIMGREMYNGTTKTNGGTIENISLEGVAAGYYIVNISSPTSKQTFKVFLK